MEVPFDFLRHKDAAVHHTRSEQKPHTGKPTASAKG